MIRSFRNQGTEDVFHGEDSTAARRTCPQQLWGVAGRKLDQLNRVSDLRFLAIPPGNHFEALKGKRQRQHSIRINDQYRICFRWLEDGAHDVHIVDYH
jgi:proteic killer suppression protein